MDRKKLVLLVDALVVAIGTALAARTLFVGASTPQAAAVAIMPQPTGPKVLVAQRALPTGTIITADAVAFQAWPKDMVQDAYFIDGEADVSKLLGTVVRIPVTAGQPVTQGALVQPGDRGFLAAALGPGMRAYTIAVAEKAGVAGFVFPGDHVDVMLTQSVQGAEGTHVTSGETILRNLRVLATDQSATSKKVNGETVVRTFRSVTLEVTPRLAEKLAVAEKLGTLSLSLRSIADNQAELEHAIASGQVKVPDNASKDEEDAILNRAMHRPLGGSSSYITGADVSRFEHQLVFAQKRVGPSKFVEGDAAAKKIVRVARGKKTEDVELGGN